MRIVTTSQRTPDWYAARVGYLTGSCAADMLATIKSGEAAARRNLRVRLALERITRKSLESTYQSAAMVQGIEREADACLLYEALTGRVLSATGFIAHDTLLAGCSLDGYIGDFDGIIEVKSPTPAIHLDYLKTGAIPLDYYKQIVHGLWISGAKWCDWLSFNPDFPEPLQSKLLRVNRDDAAIKAYESIATAFLAEVDVEVENVRKMAEAVPA